MPQNNTENYQAKRSKKEAENDSSKKAVDTAAKGALNYFTGGQGGAMLDAAKKVPGVGKKLDKAEEKIAKTLNRGTGGKFGKIAKKADDAKLLDAANKVMSAGKGGASESTGNTAGAGSGNSSGSNQSGVNSLKPKGKGLGSSLGKNDDNSETEDNGDNKDEKTSSGNLFGSTLLPGKKGNPIFITIGAFFFLIIMCVLCVIGSSDEDDAENGIGNPSKEDAKGTKYEKDIQGNYLNGVGGTCTYEIKGATNGQSTVDFKETISDLKVRLMHSSYCDGTDNVPIEGESLIDFETYILGVVYAEVGGGMNEAEAKTQAVAARSFILDRAIRGVGRNSGTKLENENGQWVLQVRNCVADQVFCNPDLGCSKRGEGSNERLDVYSGINKPITYKDPLPQDAKSRQWVAETAGQLLVTNSGYIVGTNYDSTGKNGGGSQEAWRNLGYSLDYKQILLQQWGSNKDIYTASCTAGSVIAGNYSGWKQYDFRWSAISLGNSYETIRTAGCLATSISMLIAKSGVTTNVNGEFNPGSFVEKLNTSGGFDRKGNLQWNVVSSVAPNFQYQQSIDVSNNSKKDKLNNIKELLNSGYYVVAEVKGNTGQHWVAIDSVNGDIVNMMDPGSTSTNMWQEYNWTNTSRLVYFKVV